MMTLLFIKNFIANFKTIDIVIPTSSNNKVVTSNGRWEHFSRKLRGGEDHPSRNDYNTDKSCSGSYNQVVGGELSRCGVHSWAGLVAPHQWGTMLVAGAAHSVNTAIMATKHHRVFNSNKGREYLASHLVLPNLKEQSGTLFFRKEGMNFSTYKLTSTWRIMIRNILN